jgi:SAM-dependent methyltransferase
MKLKDERLRLLLASLRKRGVRRTTRLVVEELLFDLVHRTDTAGIVPLDGAPIASIHRKDGEQYQPANPWAIRAAFAELKTLGLALEQATLVDLGSGKGRVLLLALAAGFARVVGVEFNPALCRIGAENLRKWSARHPNLGQHDTLCTDAADFDLPSDIDVLFLFNPFQAAVMAKVAQKVEATLNARPRPLFVVYLNPVHAGIFQAIGFTALRQQDHEFVILRRN